ncbi:MAG: hypothetical protein DDT19_00950 [Syntrophomonadaceae bacterium]|nr:hypothetical protein [Bacillota bacterium]
MGPEEHIQRDLEDAGISHPSEWRKAVDLETPLEGEKIGEKGIESDHRSFEKLLTYLDGEKKVSESEKIKKFGETKDSVEKLELLRTMSLRNAITAIREHSKTEGSYKYLADRLDFYQKFISGEAVKRKTEQEWDSNKNAYVDVVKEYQIDASNASPETIRLGLWRDMLYAAMQGTPEMGAVKIATKRINRNLEAKAAREESSSQPTKIKSAVELFGYYSGIFEGSLGQWSDLGDLYKKCLAQVQRRHEKEKLTDEQLEHKAVRLMASRIEGAYEYNGVINTSASPYDANFKEAIAVGQLGHKVMRQMRGMRNKIQETNFEHVERFIGKSGDNRYAPEKKRLDTNIEALKECLGIAHSGKGHTWGEQKLTGQEAAQAYVEQENKFALQKQQQWFERETERLNHKFEKSKAEIEKANLPEDEKELQRQSVAERHQKATTDLQAKYQTETTRLQSRTPEQLLADLEQRQTIVNERFEKRKSLAQKALDLHFKINHTGGDYDSKPLAHIIDWINYAPFGAIKRAHKMMRLGMSDETITEHSLADIIAGQRGATREDLRFVHNLVEKAKGQDYGARQILSQMMKVGSILSVSGYEVSLQEVGELASKNFYGMTGALKKYDLEQVKQFIDAGINLQFITTVKEVTDKLGYNLGPQEVAEMAAHNIDGLENAFKIFNLDEVRVLLKQDVNLPVAEAVLNNTRQFGYELDINQIASVAKNVHDVNDFISALRGLPLAEVEMIFSDGISYGGYNQVKEALAKHQYDSSFTAVHSLARKLTKTQEYYNLDSALDTFTLKEIEQITDKGGAIGDVLEVGNALKEKQVPTNLQEVILFEKYAGDYSKGYHVTQAIDTFGIDDVRKIVARGCRLDKAIELDNYMRGSGYSRSRDVLSVKTIEEVLTKGGVEAIIAITKAGSPEVVLKTIEAGFTVEEITKFPFLISPLVTKK